MRLLCIAILQRRESIMTHWMIEAAAWGCTLAFALAFVAWRIGR